MNGADNATQIAQHGYKGALSLMFGITVHETQMSQAAEDHGDRPRRSHVDFLYVGMSKSGSTHFYQLCKEHPEIYVPVIKDIYYFDQEYCRGLDWYLKFFEPAASNQKRGEVCHDYFFSPAACERIHKDFPDTKIIIFVREPISWLISRYKFDLGRHKIRETPIAEFARLDFVERETRLGTNLRLYKNTFGPQNISVFFYDDLQSDPVGFYRSVFDAIGVSFDVQLASLTKIVLPAHEPRSDFAAHLAQWVSDSLRRAGFQRTVGYVKQLGLLEWLLFKPVDPSRYQLTTQQQENLVAFYRREVEEFAQELSRELPVAWKSTYGLQSCQPLSGA